MTLLGLCSTYKEGPLVQAGLRSLIGAVDKVIVFEGPAGPPLEADCPETEPGFLRELVEVWREGAWKTDAAKRTAMIAATRDYEPPVWGLWLDGDEILVDGEYLRDELRVLEWQDDPAEPFMGWPIKLVEHDGSVAVCRGKVIRCDLIDSYSVSSSVFKNVLGFLHGEGNVQVRLSELPQSQGLAKLDRLISLTAGKERASFEALLADLADKLVLVPPLPGEPHLVHRSHLRHPARRGLRLHEQEAVEIERATNAG